MESGELVAFYLLAFLAEVLGTVGGFGSSMFFVPMAAYFLDFQSVLGITALFHVISNLTKIAYFRKGYDKQLILFMGVPAVVAVVIGAFLSRYVDGKSLELSLAMVLIGLSLVFLIFPEIRFRPTTANAIWGGSMSGFIAGIVGTGGAIRGIMLASFQLSKEAFISTSAWIDLGIDLSRSLVYFSNGYINLQTLYVIPGLLVSSILGTALGKYLLKFVSDLQFQKLVLLLVLGIGASMLVRILF